jgi:putative DNA primase/helicase
MIAFTRYTARRPEHLSKKFRLRNGQLMKENGGKLIDGIAERIKVPDLREFAAVQQSLDHRQALGYGVNGHDRARVVPRAAVATTEDALPVIARDHESIHWPEGAGIFLGDYDPRDGEEPLDREQLLDLLYAQWPALRDGPHLWRPSASSCIVNGETGEELRGVRGQRMYAHVRDASDLPRAGQVLVDRTWLAGHGWVMVSKSGQLLLRCPVDATVFQPERLDFAGGAECVPPLVQRLPEPLVLNPDAEPIDTKATLRDLTEAEREEVTRLQTEAKAAKAEEAAAVRASWMDGRMGDLTKRHPDIPEERLRAVLRQAVEGQVLTAEFILYDARRQAVTVAELLANPAKWHGKYVRDPLEPGYSTSAAWVCIDGKGAFLYSHAHGLGVRYTLMDVGQMFGDESGAGAEGKTAGDGAEAAQEPLQETIDRLAALPRLQYELARAGGASRLGLRVGVLDDAVKAARTRTGLDSDGSDRKQGRPVTFEEVEPWSSPVGGAQLLDDLVAAVNKVMVLPPHAAEGIALWIVFTYLLDAANHAPLLVLTSPVKRCGKTLLIDLLAELVHRPLPTNNISAAALFRVIEASAPCLLFDEVDALLESDSTGEIRGLLNAGHTRATAHVIRTVGEDFEPREFTVWSPKVLALIGRLDKRWATVADRAVLIPLQRKSPSLKKPGVKRAGIDFSQLRSRTVRWAADHAEVVRESDPATPEGLNDRAADNWRVLIAIADMAGGVWPAKARTAALYLSGGDDTLTVDDGAGVRLLADIRDIFNHVGTDRITSAALVEELGKIDEPEAPWAEWNRRAYFGGGIEARQIAVLLKPFGIRPGTIRLPDDKTAKGYSREKFEEAFASYLR